MFVVNNRKINHNIFSLSELNKELQVKQIKYTCITSVEKTQMICSCFKMLLFAVVYSQTRIYAICDMLGQKIFDLLIWCQMHQTTAIYERNCH